MQVFHDISMLQRHLWRKRLLVIALLQLTDPPLALVQGTHWKQ